VASLRVSIEATGAFAEDAATYVATFISLIEGATPYVRPQEHFITPMMPAPCVEQPDNPPSFSVFINITERPSALLASFIALRINPNSRGITSCVAHEATAIRKDGLQQLCKDFVRLLADNPGGIRWQHNFSQALRDIIDP
jgi:hypothetical protein